MLPICLLQKTLHRTVFYHFANHLPSAVPFPYPTPLLCATLLVYTLQVYKQSVPPHDSIRTDTAMPLTSSSNGASPFSNHLHRVSTPSYRLQHEYRGSHKPHDELERISTLQSLAILDTKPEPKYDDITKLLCSIFNMPIAQLSLVDSDRQWCKSLHGHDVREIDRNQAFCAWVLLPKHPKALMVEDTLLDARYASACLAMRSFWSKSTPILPQQLCYL